TYRQLCLTGTPGGRASRGLHGYPEANKQCLRFQIPRNPCHPRLVFFYWARPILTATLIINYTNCAILSPNEAASRATSPITAVRARFCSAAATKGSQSGIDRHDYSSRWFT